MSHIHIEMKNVRFSYDGKTPVLSGIDFYASENESIGIIGANGAGKSTFLKLLVGLEPGFEGVLRIAEPPL